MENGRRGKKNLILIFPFVEKKAGLFPTLHAVIGLCLVLIKLLHAGLNRALMGQTATRNWRNSRKGKIEAEKAR